MNTKYLESVITHCYDLPFAERGLLLYAFKSDSISADIEECADFNVVTFSHESGFILRVYVDEFLNCNIDECDNLSTLLSSNFDLLYN